MSLFRSAAVIGFFTLLSRILGFLRDICIAAFVGANAMTDAFFVSFKIPNFMRRLFAEGAFNSAFVPLYASTLEGEGKERAQQLASQTLSVLLASLLALTVIVEIFMPEILLLFAPGFVDEPDKFALTTTLTRITFPYIVFISVVSLLGGILNSIEKFAAVASAPILLNIALITAIVGFRDAFPTPAHALSTGVLVAGFLQLVWLWIFCRAAGFLPRLHWPKLTKEVKKLLVIMAPAALGAGVAQVNLLVDMIIASTVPEGVSYLYYADRINQLPLGVIGVGVGTALLPMLSRQLRAGNKDQALETQNRAIELVLLFALPASAAFLVIAQPLITTLFEHGAFSAAATSATYPALIAYGTGLPAFVLVKVLAPGFFANHDTKTPFIIASICMVLNLVLNLALVGPLQHVGLAIATSIASWVNVGLMAWKLKQRGLLRTDATLRRRLPRFGLASALMAAGLFGGYHLLAPWFEQAMPYRITALFVLVAGGLGVYTLLVMLTRAMTIGDVKALMKRGG